MTLVEHTHGLALRWRCCLGFLGIPEGAKQRWPASWPSTWTVLPAGREGSTAWEQFWASEETAAGEEPQAW